MLVAMETICLYLELSAIMGKEVFISVDQFCGTAKAVFLQRLLFCLLLRSYTFRK